MDKKRKAWCEKYKVKIADEGFIDVFSGLPEHVQPILPKQKEFIGFNGDVKRYEELTEEEIEDLNQRETRIIENLQKFADEKSK
jgi:hypothetical protein